MMHHLMACGALDAHPQICATYFDLRGWGNGGQASAHIRDLI